MPPIWLRAKALVGRAIAWPWMGRSLISTIRGPTGFLLVTIGILVISSVLYATVVPLITTLVADWSRNDVELRARMINASASDQAEALLKERSPAAIAKLRTFFERIATDERLLALAICDKSDRLRAATRRYPRQLNCMSVPSGTESTASLNIKRRTLLISSFPLAGGSGNRLVIVHDLAYARARQNEARLYLSLGLGVIIILASISATLVVLLLLRNWQETLRGTIAHLRAGRIKTALPVESWGRELRAALEQYDLTRRTIDGIHVDWTPETLKRVLSSELPGVQTIAVSNREPYIHKMEDGQVLLQRPASGLVAALEPVMRACNGVWIAHGSGTADRQTVDGRDRIAVPPQAPAYTLRRLWLSAEEQDGYYYGFANEGLWPLCHIAFIRPTFREGDWQQYVAVNARFADAVVAEARRPDPVVLVQDYHFALLPRMLRERLPQATIITFWHIPWPNAESFGVCPWKREIVEGLLGSSILGFHTQFHCNNFLETVDRVVESRIDREWRSVAHEGTNTLVRPYPISIEWPPSPLATQPSIEVCRANVRRRFNLPEHIKLGVGIERLDYTKGVLDRIRAIDAFLEAHPEWKGGYTFLQAAAPSRGKLLAYQNLQQEAEELVRAVNARHGTASWQPIMLSIRHHEPHEVFELFRAADHCIVSSLHDGMNLVAKEFVAARDDEAGVLILSTFAGASRELSEALIFNPYHAPEFVDAISHALTMPRSEQEARMRLMRARVRSHNVYAWAGQMLLDAAQLRRRKEIAALAAAEAARQVYPLKRVVSAPRGRS